MPGYVSAAQALLHMEIGDQSRKNREVPVVLDGITETATGAIIAPDAMVKRLEGTGILLIGENHTSMDFHRVQLQTIKALHEAGREVLIGLEMFPYPEQPSLEEWHSGRVTEADFVERARWYDNWGYHWNYYRDIFAYARQQAIAMHAVNVPRAVVKAVRKDGFAQLGPAEAAHLPPRLAPDSEEHQRMYRAFFDQEDALHMNDQAFEGLYRAQVTWDAAIGWNALQALKQHGGPKAIMVVLMGAGHVTYGLGAERQIAPYYEGRISSLVPVPVLDEENQPVGKVRASYASFLWGVPQEAEPLYPALGVSLMGAIGAEPTRIIQVSEHSVSARSGLRVGDVLLGLDGAAIASESVLRRLMADYRWGDVARIRIRREGRELELEVPLRRTTAP